MRALITFPFYGELSWELMNWIPHIRWQIRQETFRSIVSYIRRGRDILYSFAHGTHIWDGFEHMEYCNRFYPACEEANEFASRYDDESYSYYRNSFMHPDRIKTLHLTGVSAKYSEDELLFDSITPHPSFTKKWEGLVSYNAVIMVVQHLDYGAPGYNTTKEAYEEAVKAIDTSKLQIINVGIANNSLPFELSGLNLINKVSYEDLLSLFELSALIVGPLNGLTIFGATTGTPSVAWGNIREMPNERVTSFFKKNSSYAKLHYGKEVSPSLIGSSVAEILKEI